MTIQKLGIPKNTLSFGTENSAKKNAALFTTGVAAGVALTTLATCHKPTRDTLVSLANRCKQPFQKKPTPVQTTEAPPAAPSDVPNATPPNKSSWF